jgi:hypothetical protein
MKYSTPELVMLGAAALNLVYLAVGAGLFLR